MGWSMGRAELNYENEFYEMNNEEKCFSGKEKGGNGRVIFVPVTLAVGWWLVRIKRADLLWIGFPQ